MKNLRVLAIVCVFLSSTCFAGVFSFQLLGLPKESRHCLEQAQAMALRFEKETGKKVGHVECLAESPSGYDFKWEYEADKAVPVVSTDYSAWETTPSGRYREPSECLGALSQQREIFIKATGLSPIFSYCRRQKLDFGKNWELILIAIGESQLKPQLGGYLWFSEPQQITLSEIKEALDQKMKTSGAVLGDVINHYNTVMGAGTMAVHYFSSKTLHFTMERVVQVPLLNICLQGLDEAKNFLDFQEGTLFVSYCGKSSFGNFDLHLGFAGEPTIRFQSSAQKFSSLSECEERRAGVVKEYSGSALEPLLGGLCSKEIETDKYAVILFKKRK